MPEHYSASNRDKENATLAKDMARELAEDMGITRRQLGRLAERWGVSRFLTDWKMIAHLSREIKKRPCPICHEDTWSLRGVRMCSHCKVIYNYRIETQARLEAVAVPSQAA